MNSRPFFLIYFLCALTGTPTTIIARARPLNSPPSNANAQPTNDSDLPEAIRSYADQPLQALLRDYSELKGVKPAQDQSELPEILRQVGEKVEAFFHDFSNTSSLEQVNEEYLKRDGKIKDSATLEFQYVCLTSPTPETPGLNEYRMGGDSEKRLLSQLMLTSGFIAASLPFHPHYQSESNFRLIGWQIDDGRPVLVIAYAQRPDKSRLHGRFNMGAEGVDTFSQGFAWVDGATYQIIRMRTDLLTRFPKVRLDRETTVIRYGEVRFKNASARFWLPLQVTVIVEWQGRIFRNTHSYSDFKLFNVEATQRQGKPQ